MLDIHYKGGDSRETNIYRFLFVDIELVYISFFYVSMIV